jgi:hypothetical protein
MTMTMVSGGPHARVTLAFVVVGTLLAGCEPSSGPGRTEPATHRPRTVVLNDDGGWCWFQDERAIIVAERLVFGSVAAGRSDPGRLGAVEVTGVRLDTGETTRIRLDEAPLPPEDGYDDHEAPAFIVRGDGRLLVVYAAHGTESRFRYRISERPADPAAWGEEHSFAPSPSSRVTYSNLHRLAVEDGRIYDFYRGLDDLFKPSVAWSDDEGETWTSGGVLLDVPSTFPHRPYVKYVSDGRETVHLLYTEGHPRDLDNSVFHVALRGGVLHRSDGAPIRPLAVGLRSPEEGTRVFPGDADDVAWVVDAELDAAGRPFVAYSVQKGSAGRPPGEGGEDHRYRRARWIGSGWEDEEIAFAGTRLYPGEDDYTGGWRSSPATRTWSSSRRTPTRRPASPSAARRTTVGTGRSFAARGAPRAPGGGRCGAGYRSRGTRPWTTSVPSCRGPKAASRFCSGSEASTAPTPTTTSRWWGECPSALKRARHTQTGDATEVAPRPSTLAGQSYWQLSRSGLT